MKRVNLIAFRVFHLAIASIFLFRVRRLRRRLELVINATFTGGNAPSDMAGGGNLTTIFDTAISYWEAAFADPNESWVVNIQYQWAPLSGVNGQFQTTRDKVATRIGSSRG